jgi:hypothetical protein
MALVLSAVSDDLSSETTEWIVSRTRYSVSLVMPQSTGRSKDKTLGAWGPMIAAST